MPNPPAPQSAPPRTDVLQDPRRSSGAPQHRAGLLAAAVLGCLSLGLITTCGDRGDEQSPDNEDPNQAHLVSLTLTPDNDVLLVDLNKEETKAFKVRALFSDGSSADWTRRVKWRLTNPAVGKFSGGAFKSAVLDKNKVEFTKVYASFNDGVRDLAAVANLTVVWLRTSGNSQDFFFNLPYKIDPQTKPLTFSTEVQSLDVFFAEDTTGSMGGSITQLNRSLQNTIIPGVKMAAAKDAWFGVGAIDDFPAEGHGSPGCNGQHDEAFILIKPMTDSLMEAVDGVSQLLRGGSPAGCGADLPEGQMEALYQIATGDGNVVAGVSNIPANHKGIGGVQFRDGALPVVVLITDASFHSKDEVGRSCFGSPLKYNPAVAAATHTRKDTIDALNKICAKVVGISNLRDGVTEECLGTRDLTEFSVATGALVPPEAWDAPARPANCDSGKCCTGLNGVGEDPDMNGLCPLTFKSPPNGSGIGDQVSGGIAQLARFASFDVVTNVVGEAQGEKGEALPAGKTTGDFIKTIVPLDALPPPPPPFIPPPVMTEKGFSKVVPGGFVRFNVTAHNEIQKQTFQPQVFHATIRVRAGGCANLDSRDVIILIPPLAPTPG